MNQAKGPPVENKRLVRSQTTEIRSSVSNSSAFSSDMRRLSMSPSSDLRNASLSASPNKLTGDFQASENIPRKSSIPSALPNINTHRKSSLNVGCITRATSHGLLPQVKPESPRSGLHPLSRNQRSISPEDENEERPSSAISMSPLSPEFSHGDLRSSFDSPFSSAPSSPLRSPQSPKAARGSLKRSNTSPIVLQESLTPRPATAANLETPKRLSRFSEGTKNSSPPGNDGALQRKSRFAEAAQKTVAQQALAAIFKISSPKKTSKPKRTISEEDILIHKEEYDRLAYLSRHPMGNVSMDIITTEWLSNYSVVKFPPFCLPAPLVMKTLRQNIKSCEGITFQKLLAAQYPGASKDEILYWVDFVYPQVVVEDVPPDEQMMRDMNAMWEKWDLDGSGDLHVEEFKKGMQSFGVVDQAEFDEIYHKIDTNNSGKIEKAEFMSWWCYGDNTRAHKFT